ncbi:CPBP family intramembrane metalloprotease [Candidatus Bathyarchaeota archaeon]|nr:CPBP family intramembrane metalloprotease [Candidatus Bathyarchaeota archaeon]MBS7636983.1 CPBP family intramembrane metalloprotease [Candidatus Bathyarchaeota archaeon]
MIGETKEGQQIPVSEALLAVVASLLLSLFLAGFIANLNYGVAMVIAELLLTVVPFGYMLSKKIDVKKYVRLELNPRNILLGVAFGSLLVYFDFLIVIALTSLFGPSKAVEESNRRIAEMTGSIDGLIFVAAALIAAGICEEFAFRGFLQTAISGKYPQWMALVVSAFAFGFLLHFDPQGVYIIAAFLIGLVLGLVYHLSRSYTVCATAHATLNIIILALTIF